MCFCLNNISSLGIRKVASLVELMNSYAPGTTHGGNYIKRLESDKNSSLTLNNGKIDAKCCVTSNRILDILWWRDHIFDVYRDFSFKTFTGVLTCDASNVGWGAHYKEISWNGRWNETELSCHINVLELYAIYLSLKSLLSQEFRGSYFNVRTDNTTAVSYENKKGGTKSLSCAKVAFMISNGHFHKIFMIGLLKHGVFQRLTFLCAFPPFSLISRVWSKLTRENSHAILIYPDWPSQPWYLAGGEQRKGMSSSPKGNST